MFADRARIFIRSGKGGDGHVSFRTIDIKENIVLVTEKKALRRDVLEQAEKI